MGNQCKMTLFGEEDLEINIIEKKDSPQNTFKEIDDLKNEIMELSLFERNKIAKIKYNNYINKSKNQNLNQIQIKKEYLAINELLLLNNTNKNFIKLYLNFIKENDTFIKKYNLIPYEKELLKYQKLFSIKEMDEIEKNFKKFSEKENLVLYLRYLANSTDYKEICAHANESIKSLFYFNYPIEFNNQELYYYKFYILLIIEIYMTNKKENEENCKKYIKNRISIAKLIIEKDILNNRRIIDSEDKMNILMILVLLDSLDDNNESINFNRLLQDKGVTFLELESFVKNNNIGRLYSFANENKIFIDDLFGEGDILSTSLNTICLKNLLNRTINIHLSPYIYNNLDSLLMYNDLSKYIKDIKNFLIRIVNSNVYNEAIKILFKDKSKYLIDKNITDIEYFINNRIKFYPFQILNISGLTDKFSCYSFIPTISYSTTEKVIKIPSQISVAIENSLHEINHINQNLIYFKGNNLSLFNTPTRVGFKSGKEGGENLEEILFGKKIEYIGILESIYILNEKNYAQTLEQFKNNFSNLYNFNIPLKKKINKFLTIQKDGIFREICSKININVLEEGLYKKGLYSLSAKNQLNNFSDKLVYISRGKCCLGSFN